MFFTPNTICCGGIVLDYLSMLMIINEERPISVFVLWHIDSCSLEYTFSLFVQVMTDAQHLIILPHFPFTLVLTDIMDHCETF